MDFLEAEGWLENSIIVVASDNGGCPFTGGCNYPLKGVKQSMFEGGTKVSGIDLFVFCCGRTFHVFFFVDQASLLPCAVLK